MARHRGKMTLLAVLVLTAAALVAVAQVKRTPEPSDRRVTADEAAMLDHAEQILISQCMEERGFTFIPMPRPPQEDRRFFYVIDDVAWAREHGYGRRDARRMMQIRQTNPNRQYLATLTPGERRALLAALNGERPEGLSVEVPLGGRFMASDTSCRADAQRRLYGNLKAWFEATSIVSNLAAVYVPQVKKDPRYGEAVADWARCMQQEGHPYASPDELRAALSGLTEGLDPAAAHAAEVRLAVAEATCAQRTSLAATAAELDRHYGGRVREQYRSYIETRRRLQLAALARAREIIARGPGS